MSRTLFWYILKDLLRIFLFASGVLAGIMSFGGLLRPLTEHGLNMGQVMHMLTYFQPPMTAYSLPIAALFATTIVYGRLSADNEIVATKALGITPMILLWPAWIIAFGLSLVGVWLTDLAFSWGAVGAQRVVIQSVEEIAYGMLRTQKSYANQRFSIVVKEVQERRLIAPIMYFQANNDMPAIRISAAEAELKSDLARSVMTLILTDCEIEMSPGIRSVLPGRTEQPYPLSFFSAKDMRAGNPTNLPLRQIASEIPLQEQQIVMIERSLAAQSALALITGELDDLSEATWKPRRKQLTDARSRLFRLKAEPCRRWANGFSTLAFVLIGAPLAILLKRADVMTRFGYSFLPILLTYYPTLIGCCDRAKSGGMPPYIVWLPNLVLAAVGLCFLKWVVRY